MTIANKTNSSKCGLFACGKPAAKVIEQTYANGEKITLNLCRDHCKTWLKKRKDTCRVVSLDR